MLCSTVNYYQNIIPGVPGINSSLKIFFFLAVKFDLMHMRRTVGCWGQQSCEIDFQADPWNRRLYIMTALGEQRAGSNEKGSLGSCVLALGGCH